MFIRFISAITLFSLLMFGGIGCKSTGVNPSQVIELARQGLDALPEPTFSSLEVYTHDLSATGTALLLVKYPDSRIPLRIVADSALSILEAESITMVDVIALSNSLDEIKEGKVKLYLDIAWKLLELNNVIRRDDLTATLTAREQKLLIALFHGVQLGTGGAEERDRILNSYGPRYALYR